MNVRYRVTLTTEERQQLELLVRGGKSAVRMIKRAQSSEAVAIIAVALAFHGPARSSRLGG